MVMGIDKNVGGVGIAMLLLIFISERLRSEEKLPAPFQHGISFWNLIYIPIVVAMAASQNVVAAISGGPLALATAVLVVAACFALVPVLNRGNTDPLHDSPIGADAVAVNDFEDQEQ